MEWCQDWYDGNFYASSPKNEPICQQKTDNRACRGGAFADRRKGIRPAYRNKNKPTCDSNTMGFRLCIDASATTEKSTIFAAGSK
jgi:formylglycine-generating enzyme required for sulfatase activity